MNSIMNIIDLYTFEQLINIRDDMHDIIMTSVDYPRQLDIVYKKLDKLIMDITEKELEHE